MSRCEALLRNRNLTSVQETQDPEAPIAAEMRGLSGEAAQRMGDDAKAWASVRWRTNTDAWLGSYKKNFVELPISKAQKHYSTRVMKSRHRGSM